jgi:pilus assembly protein Flp/PilA
VKKLIAKFSADQPGATAIEYGLIAASISPASLGSSLNTKFTSINSSPK